MEKKLFKKVDISVVIPTRNRTRYITRCLFSLSKQTVIPIEIIIIDNSDTNQLVRYIPKLKKIISTEFLYFKVTSIGSSNARNIGISKSVGKIIAFLDDDCIPSFDWLENIYTAIQKNPNSIIMGENRNGTKNYIIACVEEYRNNLFFKSNLYYDNGYCFSRFLDSKNFAITAETIKKNNLFFDTSLFSYVDLDFGLSALKSGIKIIYDSKIVVTHHGITTFENLLRREIRKGRNKVLFRKKWNNIAMKHFSLMVSVSLLHKVFNNKPLKYKIAFFPLLIASRFFTFIGEIIEHIH